MINLVIRVLNDHHDFLILNGPEGDPFLSREFNYHFRFNAKSGSTFERCINDLERFVIEQGEPWFNKYKNENEEQLISDKNSPLDDEIKSLLKEAQSNNINESNIKQSLKLLGIKRK